MKKNIGIKILGILMIGILMATIFARPVFGDDLSNVNKKIEEAKKEKTAVQNEKSTTMKQIQNLTAEISEKETELSRLKSEIAKLEKEIKEKEKEIIKKQNLYDENFEKFKSRLVASYEAGKTTYLDVILSSKKLTDILANWFYLTEIADADKSFMDSLEKQKQDLENSKVALENNKKQVEANKANVEKTTKSLKSTKQTKDAKVSELSDSEKKLQADLDQYEKDKAEIQRELEKIANQNPQEVGPPSTFGFISPLAGRTTKDIYCGWNGYPGHKGVDFSYGGITGQNILAVKSGTVLISKALKYSNGQYRSYGEYVAIDHHDGSITLYAHGLPGSRKVSEGQNVKQGQAIMQVGTTGNSTGPHLHFEIRINGVQVNPTPYLP